MREPTVRTQKIHRNYLKIRLIIFGTLALALVIASYFSESLCPYDPYLQDFRQLRIYLVRIGMEEICFLVSLQVVKPVFTLLYYW